MTRYQRLRLSTATRALDYARAHPATDASFTAVVTELAAQVAQGEALTVKQLDSAGGERGARATRKALRTATLREQLRHVAHVAERATPTHPELEGHFILPANQAPNRVFIASAKAMLAAATPEKDLFISLGLGEHFLEALAAAIDAYDTATLAEHDGRGDHITAKTDLTETISDCLTLVGVLDGLYRTLFSGSPDVLAGWESASNVAGPFTRSTAAPAPEAPPAETPPANQANGTLLLPPAGSDPRMIH